MENNNNHEDDMFNMQTFDVQSLQNLRKPKRKSIDSSKINIREEKKRRKKIKERNELIAKAISISIFISFLIILIDRIIMYTF